jgi:carbonic anhydrase
MYTVEDMDNAEDDTEFTRIIEASSNLHKDGTTLEVNLQKLLPKNKSYYTYKGSLTSPPCTETLLWHVMSTPMKVSKKVVEVVQNAVVKVNPDSKYDTRLTLPLHERKVFWYNDANAENTKCPPETFSN